MTSENISAVAQETGLDESYVRDVLALRATQPYPESLVAAFQKRGLIQYGEGRKYGEGGIVGGKV